MVGLRVGGWVAWLGNAQLSPSLARLALALCTMSAPQGLGQPPMCPFSSRQRRATQPQAGKHLAHQQQHHCGRGRGSSSSGGRGSGSGGSGTPSSHRCLIQLCICQPWRPWHQRTKRGSRGHSSWRLRRSRCSTSHRSRPLARHMFQQCAGCRRRRGRSLRQRRQVLTEAIR